MKLCFGQKEKKLYDFPSLISQLKNFIETEFEEEEFSSLCQEEPPKIKYENVSLYFMDSEDDLISINQDEDLQDALKYKTHKNKKTLKVYLIKKDNRVPDYNGLRPEVSDLLSNQQSAVVEPRSEYQSILFPNHQSQPINQHEEEKSLIQNESEIKKKLTKEEREELKLQKQLEREMARQEQKDKLKEEKLKEKEERQRIKDQEKQRAKEEKQKAKEEKKQERLQQKEEKQRQKEEQISQKEDGELKSILKKKKSVKQPKPLLGKLFTQSLIQNVRFEMKNMLLNGLQQEQIRQSQIIQQQEQQQNYFGILQQSNFDDITMNNQALAQSNIINEEKNEVESEQNDEKFNYSSPMNNQVKPEPRERMYSNVSLKDEIMEERLSAKKDRHSFGHNDFDIENIEQNESNVFFEDNDPNFSYIKKTNKFKNKMAVLQNSRIVQTTGCLGDQITLNFLVKNESKKSWPTRPLLQNFSQDHETTNYIVDAVLEPQQVFEIVYSLRLPEDFDDDIYTLNLQLVDPIKFQRFGDPMIALIRIEEQRQESSKDLGEEQKSELFGQDSNSINNQSQNQKDLLFTQCNNAVSRIDEILNGINEEDPYDYQNYYSLPSQQDEEIEKIKANVAAEREQELLKFRQLLEESKHEIGQSDMHRLTDEDKEKIDKVSRIINSDHKKNNGIINEQY